MSIQFSIILAGQNKALCLNLIDANTLGKVHIISKNTEVFGTEIVIFFVGWFDFDNTKKVGPSN